MRKNAYTLNARAVVSLVNLYYEFKLSATFSYLFYERKINLILGDFDARHSARGSAQNFGLDRVIKFF